jgi:hypothetical protein
MKGHLDLQHPLGITRDMLSGFTGATGKKSTVPCFELLLYLKEMYPRHVVFMRVCRRGCMACVACWCIRVYAGADDSMVVGAAVGSSWVLGFDC